MIKCTIDGRTQNTFAKVLADGKVRRLEINYATIKKPYSDKLATGERVTRI